MLFKTLSTLTLLAAASIGAQAQSAGYGYSCDTCSVENLGLARLLTCTCGNGRGGYNIAQIDLNQCFANVGGYVTYRKGGDFVETCWNINLLFPSNTQLVATCANGQGGEGHNQVDLNGWIGNYGGTLVC